MEKINLKIKFMLGFLKKPNFSLVLALCFIGILPPSYGVEPESIIMEYCGKIREYYGCNGNVLAYKNIFNQTIVLKSRHFNMPNCEAEVSAIVVPLDDIIGLTLSDERLLKNNYGFNEDGLVQTPKGGEENVLDSVRKMGEAFSAICQKDNSEKTGLGTTSLGFENCIHTVIQIQALLNALSEKKYDKFHYVRISLLPKALADNVSDALFFTPIPQKEAKDKVAFIIKIEIQKAMEEVEKISSVEKPYAKKRRVSEKRGKFDFQLQPPCKSLRQREKCCAGEAKLRHFLGLVLIFCRQSARYAQE